MIAPFSGKDEDRVMRALDRLVDDEAADLDPDRAIAKAAEEEDIPAGHIGLLVRGYNTARATFQRESGSNSHEKAASFPLASEAGVLGILYPDEIDTPAATERRASVSAEYDSPPTWYVHPDKVAAKKSAADVLTKAAAELREQYVPLVDHDAVARANYQSAEDRLQKLAIARRPVEKAEADFMAAMHKLAGVLNHHTGLSWADVAPNAESLHGDAGKTIMFEVGLLEPTLTKRAMEHPYHLVTEHPVTYNALNHAVRLGEIYLDKAGQYGEQANAAYEKVADDLADFDEADEDDELLGSKSAKLMNPAPRLGQFGVDIFRSLNAPPSTGGKRDQMLDQLRDPVHAAKLQDIETQAAIQNMLINDDVLSSHDPREVAQIYRELSYAAPHFARQPLLARPLLRRALTMGNLDTFDGAEAVNTDAKLRNNTQGIKSDDPLIGGTPNVAKPRA